MVYTCFYHLSGSHQHRRNVDNPNHRLFYYPICYPDVYPHYIPVCVYFHGATFASYFLIAYYNLSN